MRGFRPSYFRIPNEDAQDDLERIKQDNIKRYMTRVEDGLPLFDPEQQLVLPVQANVRLTQH